MASLVKRENGVFYAQWKDATRTPQRQRFSLGTADLRTARRLLQELDNAYALGRWDPWLNTLEDYFARPKEYKVVREVAGLFLEDRRRNGLSPATLKLYRSVLRRLVKGVGATTLLERLEPSQLNALVKDETLARSTQRKLYQVVRAFLNWSARNGYLQENPVGKVAPPKVKNGLPRAIRVEELRAICDTIQADYDRRVNAYDSREKCQEGDLVWTISLFWFAFYTGMRISEVARLKWGDIDFGHRLIYILQQKSGEQNTIPLNEKAREVLERVGEEAPDEYVFRSPRASSTERSTAAFTNRVTKLFTRYRRAAGLPARLTFHSTRHGFCTMLAMAGKSAPVIKAAARHSHIQTSMRYVDVANDFLKRELDSVFG